MVGVAAGGGGRRKRGAADSRQAHARDVARAFAEIIRDEPYVRELWATLDTEEPGIHLWLITDPLDMDTHGELFGCPIDRLLERFPREVIWLHPIHGRFFTGDLHAVLRQDAEQIPLRAD